MSGIGALSSAAASLKRVLADAAQRAIKNKSLFRFAFQRLFWTRGCGGPTLASLFFVGALTALDPALWNSRVVSLRTRLLQVEAFPRVVGVLPRPYRGAARATILW